MRTRKHVMIVLSLTYCAPVYYSEATEKQRAVRTLEVLLVDGDPSDSPLMAETYYLHAALRWALPGEVHVDSPFKPRVASLDEDGTLPDLDGADLLVLANVAGVTRPDARRIADFVKAGGGLLVFTGGNVTSQGYQPLAKAGISVGEILGESESTSLPWRLESWDEDHPVLRPFEHSQHGGLRQLAFRSHTDIRPAKDARVLARCRGGGPVLVERQLGQGRMLWFTSTCDCDWSDLPRSPLYLPLIHQMLGYLAGLTDGA